VISYRVAANTSIYQQEIGFLYKYIDLLVYRSLAKPLMLILFVDIREL